LLAGIFSICSYCWDRRTLVPEGLAAKRVAKRRLSESLSAESRGSKRRALWPLESNFPAFQGKINPLADLLFTRSILIGSHVQTVKHGNMSSDINSEHFDRVCSVRVSLQMF